MMKAIVVFSGGIDSTVVLAHVIASKKECIALSFDYRQRHRCELASAQAIAKHYSIEHKIIRIDPTLFQGSNSSLLNTKSARESTPQCFVDAVRQTSEEISSLQKKETCTTSETLQPTPSTFVPSRNLLFLSHATGMAQCIGATEIYFGANRDDFMNYPDCRDPFFRSFEAAVASGSPSDLPISILCPLIQKTKVEIIELGEELQAPLHLTWSCYNPENDQPCGQCQACSLRNQAFSNKRKSTGVRYNVSI